MLNQDCDIVAYCSLFNGLLSSLCGKHIWSDFHNIFLLKGKNKKPYLNVDQYFDFRVSKSNWYLQM